MLIGDIIALCSLKMGFNVTYLPSYGVEMRGGDAKCTIVISDKEIGSPIVGYPHCLIAMNRPSLLRYQKNIKENGILILNTSLADTNEIERNDIKKILVPANEIAQKVATSRIANMVMLGVFLEETKFFPEELIESSLEEILIDKKPEFISVNLNAIKEGRKFLRGDENGK
jgi:2-oxoglutarate ferredoxin oxidoreductase subunit gamma